MNRRRARLVLWLAALLALPVPFYLMEPELAPVARLAFLSALLGSVLVAEGGSTLGIMAGMGLAQSLFYAALLWLLTALLARLLQGLPTPALRNAGVAALVLLLLGASLGEIYRTPLSSQRPRSNLFQIFE